jgi:hypothetical protein
MTTCPTCFQSTTPRVRRCAACQAHISSEHGYEKIEAGTVVGGRRTRTDTLYCSLECLGAEHGEPAV